MCCNLFQNENYELSYFCWGFGSWCTTRSDAWYESIFFETPQPSKRAQLCFGCFSHLNPTSSSHNFIWIYTSNFFVIAIACWKENSWSWSGLSLIVMKWKLRCPLPRINNGNTRHEHGDGGRFIKLLDYEYIWAVAGKSSAYRCLVISPSTPV